MKTALICLALASLTVRARSDVNLSPTKSELDETKHTILFFADGGKEISYRMPKDWTYAKIGPEKIRFTPLGPSQAQCEIAVEPLTQPFGFDEEGITRLKEKARSLVPKDAEQVEFKGEQSNAVMIGGHETHEVTVSFVLFGQRLKMGVLFANTATQQLRFRTIAHPDTFDAVHSTFRSSLCSWQWL